ncbi:MAG: hypothetical protein WA634_05020 [Silvibacterium sp.]
MTDSLLNIHDDLDTTETLVSAAFELADSAVCNLEPLQAVLNVIQERVKNVSRRVACLRSSAPE